MKVVFRTGPDPSPKTRVFLCDSTEWVFLHKILGWSKKSWPLLSVTSWALKMMLSCKLCIHQKQNCAKHHHLSCMHAQTVNCRSSKCDELLRAHSSQSSLASIFSLSIKISTAKWNHNHNLQTSHWRVIVDFISVQNQDTGSLSDICPIAQRQKEKNERLGHSFWLISCLHFVRSMIRQNYHELDSNFQHQIVKQKTTFTFGAQWTQASFCKSEYKSPELQTKVANQNVC